MSSVAVPARSHRPLAALLIAAMLAALTFWVAAALPYLRFDPAQFGDLWSRRYPLTEPVLQLRKLGAART